MTDRNFRNLAITLGAIFLLLSLIVEILGEDFPANTRLFLLINGAQSPLVNQLMIGLSKYGREYFWIPVTLLLWLLGRETHRRTAFLLTITFLLAIILGEVSKITINAPRPELLLTQAKVLIGGESDPSFPSGHAVIVSTGAILALARLSKRVALPLTLEALLVSYSRVYVGVHWPLDVAAGWMLGGFCAMLILLQGNRFESVFRFLLKRWGKLTQR